ncbi:MAG: MarR family transcriptional regulator [Frankiales bacterium]|nr:MarR family transcriptional regulator [Frankiales bacterium]
MAGPRRARRDEAQVAHVVEQFAALFETYGFPRMSGRIITALMVTEQQGLTAAELAESLQVSPAAISTSLKYPVALGLVQRVRVPGSRRDRYVLPDDAWYVATATKNPLYRQIAGMAADGVRAVGGPGTEAGARLAEMRDFFAYLEVEVPALVERWHAGRARPR